MADDWIKVRVKLPSDGRIKIASRSCHASTVTTFGALVTLWCLGDAHADQNGVLVGYTEADIDELVCVPGFCKALPAEWIDLSGEFVKLPEYQEHNGQTAKTRAQATKRKRRERDVTPESRHKRDTSVTREEKRREEKKELKEEVLPDWLPAEKWADFVEHRKTIRKPMTERARERMLRHLADLKSKGHDVPALMDKAIRSGWQDVYEPKPADAFNALPVATSPGGGRRAL